MLSMPTQKYYLPIPCILTYRHRLSIVSASAITASCAPDFGMRNEVGDSEIRL